MKKQNSGQQKQEQRQFGICCYSFDTIEQDRPSTFLNRLPMLNRDEISKINLTENMKYCREPIYNLLNKLYEHPRQLEQIIKLLRIKRVNPVVYPTINERDDLEYYIPQLVTYMVIECNLENEHLNQLVLDACTTHFYFAHSVFFYLQSLSFNKMGVEMEKVRNFINDVYLKKMNIYSQARLSGAQLSKCMEGKQDFQGFESLQHMQLQSFAINHEDKQQKQIKIKTIEKVINKDYAQQGFLSTPKFWQDLVKIGEQMSIYPKQKKSQKLLQFIETKISPKLPSSIYIPFFKDQIRLYTILAIKKGYIFSTKQRSPYSIYLEIFNEELQGQEQVNVDQIQSKNENNQKKNNFLDKIYEKISKPFTAEDGRNTLNLKKFFKHNFSVIDEAVKKRVRFKSFYESNHQEQQEHNLALSSVYESKSQGKVSSSCQQLEQISKENSENSQKNKIKVQSDKYFPMKYEDIVNDFRKNSPYRNLKSWKMIHLMVKIGDDLKQQQFAMQLISRFQYIFEKQKVDLVLFPYEVLSLGPDCGLIQMINDVVTLDGLFKKLSLDKISLKDMFEISFHDKAKAKKNFMRSLAAYSIVTYFLQVKDRHNGNILLHRQGYIIHIDFGFLLSNAPGKGVQLQKKVPFKLLTQYVEVLGSLSSESFFEFRQLFYKGFRAVLKHKQMLISMVRMMYSSHGDTMACFKRGDQAIEAFEDRLHPHGVVQNFCYDLINNSLDNWRARWYDKFQYALQKIYY